MTATSEKSLNQIVRELLGECWHDLVYNKDVAEGLSDILLITCSKCDSDDVELSCSGKMEALMPDYANDLNAAWQCVEYMKQHGARKQRAIFIRQFGFAEDFFWAGDGLHPAKAICLAFVEAMK